MLTLLYCGQFVKNSNASTISEEKKMNECPSFFT